MVSPLQSLSDAIPSDTLGFILARIINAMSKCLRATVYPSTTHLTLSLRRDAHYLTVRSSELVSRGELSLFAAEGTEPVTALIILNRVVLHDVTGDVQKPVS